MLTTSVVSGRRSVVSRRRRTMDAGQRTDLLCPAPCAPRPGFTLVELLVVITIIGILASLSSVFIFKGLSAAKQGRTAAEVTNLASAMEEFRRQYGDYPPSYLDQTDITARALMVRFLAKAFPRCNPNVEVWYIPWCNTVQQTTYYPYLQTDGTHVGLWDPATGANITIPTADYVPLKPAQALVFWLTSISKDPVHPLSAATTDRVSFFDFDNSRITRLNATASSTNSISGSGWTVVPVTGSTPTWSQGPTPASAGSCPKNNPGSYLPKDGNQQGYVYFEARCYLFHALFLNVSGAYPPAPTATTPAPLNNPPIPYLSRSTPWDTNSNGVLDAGPTGTAVTYDVTTDNSFNILGAANGSQSFTTFQSLGVNPKSFQIIAAGLDNDFGAANTSTVTGVGAPPVSVSYNPNPGIYSNTQSYNIYYKSYPDGQGYDNITNADDDNITNFSEGPLGNAKTQ